MLITVLKKQKETGQDKTAHYSRISQVIQTPSFDLSNPEELQQKHFFGIQPHFGRRGRETLWAHISADEKICEGRSTHNNHFCDFGGGFKCVVFTFQYVCFKD